MTATVILIGYLLLGAFTAWRCRAERADGTVAARLGALVLALLLWPFVLPFHGPRTPPSPSPRESTQRAIELRDQRLSQALGRAQLAAPGLDTARIARFTARFARRLKRLDHRLGELELAVADAPSSVRGSLEELRDQTRAEMEDGMALMDELCGKLTLVAFADLGGTEGGDPGELRALLQRLEALACATREVGGVAEELS